MPSRDSRAAWSDVSVAPFSQWACKARSAASRRGCASDSSPITRRRWLNAARYSGPRMRPSPSRTATPPSSGAQARSRDRTRWPAWARRPASWRVSRRARSCAFKTDIHRFISGEGACISGCFRQRASRVCARSARCAGASALACRYWAEAGACSQSAHAGKGTAGASAAGPGADAAAGTGVAGAPCAAPPAAGGGGIPSNSPSVRRTGGVGIGAAAVAPGAEGGRAAMAPRGIPNSDPSVRLSGGATGAVA